MLTDSEVGHLWRNVLLGKSAGNQSAYLTDVFKLILKLIEERAHSIRIVYNNTPYDPAIQRACKDFGIDYADYLKAKEG